MARVEKTIEVEVPVRTAYNQWTQFEEFPQFMEGVHEVHQIDNTHIRWRADVAGREKEWDAVIREQVPDEKIIWVATDGAENAGVVRFDSVSPARTRVHLEMSYDPEGFVETVGDMLGFVSRRVEGDLQRFKDYIEARGAETGGYRREHHNPDVPGGHTRGEAAQTRDEAGRSGGSAGGGTGYVSSTGTGQTYSGAGTGGSTRSGADSNTESGEGYRGAGMEFNREDYPENLPGHSASGQPRNTIDEGGTQPSSTYRGSQGEQRIGGRAGYESSTMHSATGRDTSPGSSSGISGTGALNREGVEDRSMPYGEETPDVAGEYTGSSLPTGGMADPDREGRHHMETPGAMQPGSLSREQHQREGRGPGQTASASSSGTHPIASGEGDDDIATTGDPADTAYPTFTRRND